MPGYMDRGGRCGDAGRRMKGVAMLILSRRESEEIVIRAASGEQVTIMVVDIRGDNVRIGVDAPQSVSVHRREVQDAIDRKEPRR